MTFVGTGGVGKTSLSLTFAIEAAREGRRVAAITVDPSKRLATLLENSSEDSSKKVFKGFESQGSLEVFYVETEKIFQKFVSEKLSTPLYAKLEKNGIYKQISKNLRETHNFAALYKMAEIIESQKYDFVVLDTPPCHQVIDFFESPARLTKFFSPRAQKEQSTWFQWVQDKGLKTANKIFAKIVGPEFVDEIQSFFQSVEELREEVQRVSTQFEKTLQRPDSHLALVFSGAKDKTNEAQFLQREMGRSGLEVNSFVLNRSYIMDLDLGKELSNQTDSLEEGLYNYFVNRKKQSQDILQELREGDNAVKASYILLPELRAEMKTMESILEFSTQLRQSWEEL